MIIVIFLLSIVEIATLSEIVYGFELPVTVQVLIQDSNLSFYVGNDKNDRTTFGDMEIIEVYEEKYWSGNYTGLGKTLDHAAT